MPAQPFSLAGKTALVTGAASGLGAAIAAGLAAAGAEIVGVSHRSATEGIAERVAATGRTYRPIRADLADPACVPAVLEQAGEVDILVNNAGIIRRNDLADVTEADWDDVMNVNLKTLFFLSQAVARNLIAADRRGKIIHVASMLSYQGGIRVSSYTASKHAVMGLTRSMANELAPRGINVNAIAPGYMVTANTQALRDDPKRSAEILGRIPAGRWGEADDLAGAAVCFASAASDYVHGITLPVDGGWLAR